jgi:hypothetical protein
MEQLPEPEPEPLEKRVRVVEIIRFLQPTEHDPFIDDLQGLNNEE